MNMKKREKYDYKKIEESMTEEEIEQEISSIEPELAQILFPKHFKREFKITLKFGFEEKPEYERAVEEAKKHPTYREEGEGRWKKHFVTFSKDEVKDLHKFFGLVEKLESLEVLVEGKRIPYGRNLWLILMWFYLI